MQIRSEVFVQSCRGRFRHVRHVWPNRGSHKKGPP